MSRWARIGLGAAVGYLAVALLSSGTTALLRVFFEVARADDPPTAYLVFDLFYALVFSAAGGWLAVRVGKTRITGFLLATLVLALGIWTLVAGLDQMHPPAYQWSATVLSPLSVLLGGMLADRQVEGRFSGAAVSGEGSARQG